MSIRNVLFASVVSALVPNGLNQCSGLNKSENIDNDTIYTEKPSTMETLETIETSEMEDSVFTKEKDKIQKEISICLIQDEGSHTHTTVLNSISDPENTVLEFPINQLFDKYGKRNHPLAVSGISRNFRALLGKGGIEESTLSQKLNQRSAGITSETKYEIGDTIRFLLINPSLKGEFPKNLSDQLQEDGFETFSNPDMPILERKIESRGENDETIEHPDFIYDIVVKKLSSGKSALALYRDGELFMSTYVSVGLNGRKTKTGQFEILASNPYYYSKKYKSPMSDGLEFDAGGFWFHQGNVTGYPASHGCVRLPGVYASVLYSLVKGSSHTDVFISKNLYNIKK